MCVRYYLHVKVILDEDILTAWQFKCLIQGSIVDYGTIFNPEDDNTNIKAFLKRQVF